MEPIDYDSFNKEIEQNKKGVEEKIRLYNNERKIRTRKRSTDEARILDLISINRWKEAEKQGKIKYLGERVIYYEFD